MLVLRKNFMELNVLIKKNAIKIENWFQDVKALAEKLLYVEQ